MRRTAAGLGLVLAAGLAIVPLSAGAATKAVAATCGAVLTTNAYLKKDLTCRGDALTLKGGVVLDLRGHQLTARNGAAVTFAGGGRPTVTGGRITDSGTGLRVADEQSDDPQPTRHVKVVRVGFARNQTAIEASGTSSFFGGRTTDVDVIDSHFHRNGDAIAGVFTGTFTVAGSSFTNNRRGVHIDTGGVAVTRSYFGNNTDEGFGCEEAQCSLTDSRLENNPIGVSVRTSPLTLRRTTITGSATAVSVIVGFGLQLSDNTFARNTTGVDLTLGSATLTKNTFTDNTTGFTASSQDDDFVATLVGNRFVHNTDGVYTDEAGVALEANRAVRNTRWAFYAPHATDLGGNTQSSTGHRPPCAGVVC
jgi:hypothetical protein